MKNVSCLFKLFFLCLVSAGGAMSAPALASAQSVTPEIAERCARKWGTDYEMQAFCRKEQMKALAEIRRTDPINKQAEAVAGKSKSTKVKNWSPLNSTAVAITGNIRLSEDAMFFQNGVVMKFEIVKKRKSQKIYRIIDANQKLINNNTLCGEEDSSIYMIIKVISSKDDKDELNVFLFKGDAIPSLVVSPSEQKNMCSSFSYVLSEDQSGWSPNLKIEESREIGMIETYCTVEYPPETSNTEWRECAERQIRALEGIKALQSFNSSCIQFVVGGRGTGSMEYIDKVDLLKCNQNSNPQQKFSECVQRVTGKPYKEDSIEHYEHAEQIAECFND